MSRILVVDDNAENRYGLEVLLTAQGYQVTPAAHGREALEAARRDPPDLIIADILMPVMDGFRLCSEWKRDARLRTIPFVLYTATYTDQKDRQFALNLGADRFLVKPTDIGEILRVVHEILLARGGPDRVPPRESVLDEPAQLREYNETLIRKLEEKVLELVTANRALHEAQELARSIIETEPECVKLLTADNRVIEINAAGLAMIEAESPEQVVGRSVLPLVSPDHRAAFERLTARVFEGHRGHLEFSVTGLCGGVRWLESHAAPLKNRTGVIVALLAVTRDVTARREIDRQFRESEGKFRILVEQASDGIFIADGEGNYVDVNTAGCELVGYSREELLGMNIRDLVSPAARPRVLEEIATLRSGRLRRSTWELRRRDGSLVPVEISAKQLPDGRLQAFVRDISDRLKTERALQQITRDLEERVEQRTAELTAANSELEAFSYSVSHDLRAPLRAIDGFSGMLLHDYGGQLSGPGADHLKRIRAAADRMSVLIDDLLSLSKVTRIALDRERVNLTTIARAVAEELRVREPDRRVDVVIADDLITHGGQSLVKILLENLMGNAWKFTSRRERGRIEVGLQSHGGEPVFFVRDNGAGFNMAYAEKLFGAFQRLHAASDFPGTGIGLAIVMRIVLRHGGRVWAEAAPDQGATFFFTLRAGPGEAD